MTDLTLLKSQLGAALSAEPQKAALAASALDEISQGISKLASLGLSFFLTEGSASSPIEYPKALYRGDDFEVVHDATEEASLRSQGFDVHPTLRTVATPNEPELPLEAPQGEPFPLQPEQSSQYYQQ